MHAIALPHGAAGPARLAICRTGLWMFIVSESMIFVLLLVVRFVLAGGGHPPELSQPLAVAMTVVLLASGWPARRAVTAIGRGDHGGLARSIWGAVALGGLFLLGMAYEWAELAVSPSSPYGTVFFTTTGLHGLHVLGGIFIWLSISLQARAGAFDHDRFWGVEAAERYWRFVDVVWVFIYPIFYWL